MEIDYDEILSKHFKTLDCLNDSSNENTILKSKGHDENIVKQSDIVLGIDLGTTNTCVSIWRNNNLEIIPDEHGNRTLPSYVGFTNVNRYVGHDAKNQKELNSGNVLYEVKRLIGRKYNDPSVNLDGEFLTYNISSDENDNIIIGTEIGRKYTPEEISSMILIKAKQMATKYLGESVQKAVITVPAYFNDSQRQATKDAATIAGIDCIRIINEPTAAALAYGLIDKSIKKKSDTDKGLHIMVYDLGGGTLDVSILNITNGIFEVLASVGNTHLGGADFDNRLIGHCMNYFKKKNNMNDIDNVSMLSLQKLKRSCENAKITLSSSKKATILVPKFYNDIDLIISISRDEYINLCKDLLILCMKPIDDALKSAELDKNEIDEIILVGGMTRMPSIKNNIKMMFGNKDLNESLNPDEVVAAGAAIQGYILTNSDDPFSENVTLLDIVSLSLGLETYGGIMNVIIPRNSVVPIVKKRIYTTDSDYCKSVLIKVFEGERKMTKDNFLVGEFELGNIEPLPRGIPRIQVKFNIDVNGITTVTAQDKDNEENIKDIIISGNKGRLSKDQIEKLIKDAKEYETADNIEKHKKMLYYNIEELCHNVLENIKNENYKLSENDVNMISEDIMEVIEWLKEKIYLDRNIDDFEKINDMLNKKYGTLILKSNSCELNKNIKTINTEQNNSTNVYTDDDDNDAIIQYENPNEKCYIGSENLADNDKIEIDILRNQLITLCSDVSDIIYENNTNIEEDHTQELKYFIDDILLWAHVHQNPTKDDYIDKINIVNDSCNKIFELYQQNVHGLELSKKNELEQLCYTIKSSISNNIFSNDENMLRDLDAKIDDTLQWIVDNDSEENVDENLYIEKINAINEMCTKLYHSMLGINIY